MRTRLVAIFMLLGGLIVIALGIPLGTVVSYSTGQRLFLDRATDTERFASEAARALYANRPALLRSSMDRFREVYGIRVAVVDIEYKLVASGGGIRLDDPEVRTAFDEAVAGNTHRDEELITPWSPRTFRTSERVLVDGEPRGAVIMESPTYPARMHVLRYWLLILLGGLLFLGIAELLSIPLARWFLRPVRRMDAATVEYTAAVLAGRPLSDTGVGGGPPELRRLADSVFTMAEALAKAMHAQREFVADASHQLRNPLTALQLRLVAMREALPEEDLPAADAAAAEIERLSRTLDDLLVMARAEQDSGTPEPVRVGAVFEARIAAWRAAAQASSVNLRGSCATEASVRVHRDGLDIALDALLDNAVKFTEPGTEVELAAWEESGPEAAVVVIEVRDHGPGLRAGELERATDRFWRSRRDQNVAGSGLGLAIVERLVRRSQGTIEVRNRAEGGLVVRLTLPASGDQSLVER
ncbi:sensor histidine kinase [Sciscionella sediminilitoris]|uniref:sensor histidine kinase n=1 Tax=Sciscionella sediminilitoris TaxID=1445613 RepID=UPI0004DF3EDA|nr:HAMP domain-containing sensor histidine kinase [Sciscionella sp. SE31]